MIYQLFIAVTFVIAVSAAEDKKYTSCSQVPSSFCGPNALCFDSTSSGPYCRCLSSASGNPPNCKSICATVCKSDEYCDKVKKECLKGCESSDSCKQNEFCDFSTKQCKVGCRSSVQCGTDEYCDFTNRNCKKGCRASTSCKDDEYCDPTNRQCKKGCRRAPNNCKSKQYCDETRKCKDGCATHTDCNSNEVCLTSHKCINTCLNSPCGDNSVCSIVDRKYHCTCNAGFFPEKGKGCRPKQNSDVIPKNEKELDCKKYCSEFALCKLNNSNSISCFCPRIRGGNPYNDCKSSDTSTQPSTVKSKTL